jgi:sugar O-acyltransferase (sialic acid O-acetyltransferase NeuD family)
VSKQKLILVGDSAFAQIAKEYFDHDSDYEVVAFAVEAAHRKQDALSGLPVVDLEGVESIFDPATHAAHVAVTYTQLNRLRARLAGVMQAKGYLLASYVSSRAFVWRNAVLGEHCFVFEGNTVQPFVRIGRNVVLWSGNHIGHHSVVRDNVFVSSHVVVSGFCDIGENSFLGVNATIANNVCIGYDNWLGPSTTIMQNTEPGALYRGEQPQPSKVSALRFFRVPS